MPYSEVISGLKAIKEANGLTNREISDASGVPIGTVSRIFGGGSSSDCRYETLQPIIRYLSDFDGGEGDTPSNQEIAKSINHTAEVALYERMLELANQRHAEELAAVREAHAERLEKQREGYEDRLNKLRETSNERIREYRRWVKILSIALGVMIVFVMTMLVIDVLHPSAGWIQAIVSGVKNTAGAIWHGGRL